MKYLYNTTRFIFCGPEENRTLHSLLAREKRQPWNMRAHIIVLQEGLEPPTTWV